MLHIQLHTSSTLAVWQATRQIEKQRNDENKVNINTVFLKTRDCVVLVLCISFFFILKCKSPCWLLDGCQVNSVIFIPHSVYCMVCIVHYLIHMTHPLCLALSHFLCPSIVFFLYFSLALYAVSHSCSSSWQRAISGCVPKCVLWLRPGAIQICVHHMYDTYCW